MTSCAAFGVTTDSLDTACELSKDARKEAFSASSCSICELEGLNAFSLVHDLETSPRITFASSSLGKGTFTAVSDTFRALGLLVVTSELPWPALSIWKT